MDAGFGPSGPAPAAGPPFAVSGPPTLVLDGSRHGTASFTVSNTTGRPVRARVFAQPGAGADATWFSVAGESERSLPVAGTATVDVTVAPDAKVAAGSYTFALGAALEEAPDQSVSSPTVAFEVKPAKTRRFPWWIVVVAVVALIVLAAGGWLIFALTRSHDPVLQQSPVITGTAEVGQTLTVTPGVWDQDHLATIYSWERCTESSTEGTDGGCTTIDVPADTAAMGSATSYVVGPDDVGATVRVVEVVAVLSGDAGATASDDAPHASAASQPTATVPPPPPVMVEIPSVDGVGYDEATATLQAAQLQVSVENTDTVAADCDPPVVVQVPAAGTQVDIGSLVTIVTDRLPQKCLVFVVNPDWLLVPLSIDGQ